MPEHKAGMYSRRDEKNGQSLSYRIPQLIVGSAYVGRTVGTNRGDPMLGHHHAGCH